MNNKQATSCYKQYTCNGNKMTKQVDKIQKNILQGQ